MFALVVDDFGIQYTGKEHADHLLEALLRDYEAVTMDWVGSLFCGITLDWNYEERHVTLSMPGYVQAALEEFKHPVPAPIEHQPYLHASPQYGVALQLTDPQDDSPLLDDEGNKHLQRLTGKFLYFARAVDNTMLVALSALASQQTKGTAKTAKAAIKFLNYCATHSDAAIRYVPSDMILKLHSGASYLSESGARSRSGGFFFLGNRDRPDPLTQGPLLVTTAIMKNVLSSAAEAEIGALFDNTKKAVVLRTMLEEMQYPQPATLVQTDNSTACGIANSNLRQQRSRAIDMRFYWIRDRVRQGQFHIYWGPGQLNLADYFTKHHAASHHRAMRSHYVAPRAVTAIASALSVLQGCVKPAPQCVQSLAWSGHDWDATGSHIQHEHAGRTSKPFSITKLMDDQRQELAVA
jgi:hypothetical protein